MFAGASHTEPGVPAQQGPREPDPGEPGEEHAAPPAGLFLTRGRHCPQHHQHQAGEFKQ